METFLDQLAQKILQTHVYPEKACVVFPGRRAGVFFKKSLRKHAEKTLLAPDIFSMQDFVVAHTGLHLADAITLSFELYEVHKTLKGEHAEPFSEFLKYSSTIIHDFNEIDMHLIDPEKAFTIISDFGEMSAWDIDTSEKNTFQKKYVDFFKSLSDYYSAFTKRLLDKGLAYQGLAFKQMALQHVSRQDKWDKIYFAGFNALTPSEQKIADNIIKAGQGEMIWDIDHYYFNDPYHEAGKSLRQLQEKWPQFESFKSNHFKEQEKKISVVGAPGRVAQAKAAGELLKKFSESEDVAVVLADEALLEPLINSVPDNISTFNITMGLPLENTMLYSLFSALFMLHTSPYNTGKSKKSGAGAVYHFKDVLRVLSHPVIVKMFEVNYEGFSRSEKAPALVIQKTDKSFYSVDDLKVLHEDIGVKDFRQFKFLWDDWEQSPQKAMSSFIGLLDALKPVAGRVKEERGDVLLSEYIFRFRTVLLQINNLHEKYESIGNVEIFRRLFQQLASREEVSFRGEPLKGIQVMGVLETRLLDFQNVIALSVNEEFIPGNTEEVSFIPFEVRLHFNLPLKSDKSSVYAYHFYHLLQRAENIHLVYNNHPEGVSSNEVSRFVKQLQHELPLYNKQVHFNEKVVTSKAELDGSDEDILIEKSPSLLEAIRHKADKGFSATSLNKYRQCSLKFYFEELLGIQQHEEVEETIEARTLGNAVHKTLEKLYNDLGKGNDITAASVEQMKKDLSGKLKATFKEEYGANSFESGKNLLIYELAKHWLMGFLESEQKWSLLAGKEKKAYQFIEAEKFIEITRKVESPVKLDVKFKGHIDRIDKAGSAVRIIDYKTGRVTPAQVRLKSIDDFKGKSDRKEAFQLLFYQWLYEQNTAATDAVMPGILSFPALREGVMPLQTTDDIREVMNDFEQYLMEMVSEIFDPEKVFQKTENRLNCMYCDFKNVCNRYS